MKAVILAGGLGTRLYPLTRVTNKHLLPIYNKPMIFYPIEALAQAGIREILIVTGGNGAGEFLRLLGNGREFGLDYLGFVYQQGESGAAAALSLAESFAGGERICVILGDNIIEKNIIREVKEFERQEKGARILLANVEDGHRYGVPVMEGVRIIRIEEKPVRPQSTYAVTGIYMYDSAVFDIIRTLKPSSRGEIEITDVNNIYIERNELSWSILSGWWTDAGTFETLLLANKLVVETGANNI